MIVLLICLFAALSGSIEALLYARRGAESFTFNEHILYAIQRAMVLLLVAVAALLPGYFGTKASACLELLPALLLFPMVHDEAYNFTRLWVDCKNVLHDAKEVGIDPGPVTDSAAARLAWEEYRYGYQSPTTTARNDFNGRQRTALAVAAVVLWAAGLYVLFCR